MSTNRHLRDVHRTGPVALFVLLALAATAWGQATTEAPGELLTLKQVLALALRHSRQVQNSILEVDNAAVRVAVSMASNLITSWSVTLWVLIGHGMSAQVSQKMVHERHTLLNVSKIPKNYYIASEVRQIHNAAPGKNE